MTTPNVGFAIAFATIYVSTCIADAGNEAYVIEPPDVLQVVFLGDSSKQPSIGGKHLVGPDGTISLGDHGSLNVAGMTISQARNAIADQLVHHDKAERGSNVVCLDVVSRQSKAYYVVATKNGEQEVYRVLLGDGETAVGAVVRIEGLAAVARGSGLWVVRSNGNIVQVDWRAVTEQGSLATNCKLKSGDRLFVGKAPSK